MKNLLKKSIFSLTALSLVFAPMTAMAVEPESNTVVDIVVNSEDHNTLEAAVIAAGLAGTLSGDGPFTVFAPTDEAFAALPAGLLDDLLADPSGDLTDILLYHVVSGTALSTDLSDGQEITTLLGDKVEVTINSEGVFINDAKVTTADIVADNGVVHVIDAVLTPPADPELPATVVDIVVDSDVHNTLEDLVVGAGLAGALSADGPFTVFAPTDKAFERLPRLVNRAIANDPELLAKILKYHVVSGNIMSDDIPRFTRVKTLQGDKVFARNIKGKVLVNNARVVIADVEASNGVVHVIDKVLIPWRDVFSSLRAHR